MNLSIPEELLHDILEHLLDLPTDDEFFILNGRRDAKNAARWCIADPALRDLSRRPPALLLVCKAWHRVAVPLLYRTAIIRVGRVTTCDIHVIRYLLYIQTLATLFLSRSYFHLPQRLR